MNKSEAFEQYWRIKELAREAADGMLSYDTEGEFRLNEKEVFKFAELIVKGCIAQVRKDENGPAYEAAARIWEHFGGEHG